MIGLMSGTSMDGVDAALVDVTTAGATLELRLVGWTETRWDPDLRDRIAGWSAPGARVAPGDLSSASMAIGRLFADAAAAVAQASSVPMTSVDLVASHGQTVHHHVAPDGRALGTLQIGEPAVIAEQTGRTVVAHFRQRDIAAGGQGAPLVGFFDALLLAEPDRHVAALNLGGMANVTVIPAGDASGAVAWDTGPGNALIDGVARRLLERPLDRDGAVGATGQPSGSLVETILADAWFEVAPPRSTGRERFGDAAVEALAGAARAEGLSAADALATAAEVTARSVAESLARWAPAWPAVVHASGGGTRNRTVMRALERALERVASAGRPAPEIRDVGDSGVPASAKEAVCFAVLGHEALHGRRNSLAGATGARHDSVLGAIWPGDNYLDLVRSVPSSEATPRRLDRIVVDRSGGSLDTEVRT